MFIVKYSQCVMHVRQGIVIEYRNVTNVHFQKRRKMVAEIDKMLGLGRKM